MVQSNMYLSPLCSAHFTKRSFEIYPRYIKYDRIHAATFAYTTCTITKNILYIPINSKLIKNVFVQKFVINSTHIRTIFRNMSAILYTPQCAAHSQSSLLPSRAQLFNPISNNPKNKMPARSLSRQSRGFNNSEKLARALRRYQNR